MVATFDALQAQGGTYYWHSFRRPARHCLQIFNIGLVEIWPIHIRMLAASGEQDWSGRFPGDCLPACNLPVVCTVCTWHCSPCMERMTGLADCVASRLSAHRLPCMPKSIHCKEIVLSEALLILHGQWLCAQFHVACSALAVQYMIMPLRHPCPPAVQLACYL